MSLVERIDIGREQARRFLTEVVSVNSKYYGVKKCSTYHNTQEYPDMMLPATYNATNALILLKDYDSLAEDKKQSIVEFINSFQQPNGIYKFRHMKSNEIWKGKNIEYSWSYINNHITNYAMGAVKNLGYETKYSLSFAHQYLNEEKLLGWLNERDMTNPWLEDNNIVNMASFIIHELEGKNDELLCKLINVMIDWHDKNQDPNTGFWGTNHPDNPASQLHGMAGAAHNYHIYFYFDRKINYVDKIVDYCISFINTDGVKSACLDIDVVDILVNMLPYNYRREDIQDSLEKFAHKLLDFQNEDGGFADEKNSLVRRMDGWVNGYFEPQGYSNCFATWFRLATLGMIDCALHKERRDLWKFRNTIGIGYCKI